jgi:uncharacterized repeat protein (TIGR03803 family)
MKNVALYSAMVILVCGLALSQAQERVLYNFQNIPDGADAAGGLVFDAGGNLYGTTWGGGVYGHGSVYKLTRNDDGSWTEDILYSFTGGADGGSSQSTLVFDAEGNLFGTTVFGGLSGCYFGCGTVFELAPNPDGTWTESVISFLESGGNNPGYGVVFDAAGSLYGSGGGGIKGCGVIFQLVPNQTGYWTENVVYTFTDGRDGCAPTALTIDAAGDIYGTTLSGGSKGWGTVFQLSPQPGGGWTGNLLHTFGGNNDGIVPNGVLVFDGSGNLYGTTTGGGKYTDGVAYRLERAIGKEWRETVLHEFGGTGGGRSPEGNLVLDNAGSLCGTTSLGGSGGTDGTVFRLAPGSFGGVLLKTFSFDGADGEQPAGGVIADSAGNVYGTTTGGGNSLNCGGGCGTVFEIIP